MMAFGALDQEILTSQRYDCYFKWKVPGPILGLGPEMSKHPHPLMVHVTKDKAIPNQKANRGL